MKDEMIHSYLDGEMTDVEQKAFMEEVNANQALEQRLTSMQEIIQNTKNLAKAEVSGSFTDKVMAKIENSTEKTSAFQRISAFLFQKRDLHWNVAGAAALILLAIAVSTIIIVKSPRGITSKLPVTVASNASQSDATTNGSAKSARDNRDSAAAAQVVYVPLFLENMPNAKEISVCGDFNDWKPGEIKLKKVNSGLWTVSIPLSINKTYQYMFVVDGQKWIADPKASASLDDGFGNKNSVLDLRKIW